MTTPTSPTVSIRLFTIKEAAEVLKIPASWLYERTRRNVIPCHRLGKYLRFTEDDLAKIIAAQPDRATSPQ
ncbi:MAG: helix-turn-helix domain-containing protein [Bryobacteraceae bacterium]|nr:helix-turn-helix domain-containing protein [Bryobacteraceae bacterium]